MALILHATARCCYLQFNDEETVDGMDEIGNSSLVVVLIKQTSK
jgi:hypothetical protein